MKKLLKLIKIGEYDVDALHDPTLQLSEEAINLVASLLKVDPKKRLAAKEVLRHPWIIKNTKEAS